MPFSRPTLPQIAARVKNDLATALDSSAAFFRRSFERGVQAALSGVSHHLHGHLEWISRQIDPATSDEDILETVHAASVGITRRTAVAAQFTITTTGTAATDVPAGTAWTRGDGTRYTSDALATVAVDGTVTIEITADDEGADPNMDVGEELTIESPIAGLSTEATVASIVTEGSNEEDAESLLTRVQQRRRTPPRGGAPGDYEAWLLEVPGITRAWEFPRREGAGTVTCYVVNDDLDPITVSGATITAAETYLDAAGRQPTTVDVYVYTPTLVPLNITVAISPNTTAVQDAITAQLEALILREATPEGMTLFLSQIDEAISIASGEINHEMTVPAADVDYTFGTMPSLGTITFSELP